MWGIGLRTNQSGSEVGDMRTKRLVALVEVTFVDRVLDGDLPPASGPIGALGHDGGLMPPAYVKPYVKREKTDADDTEAQPPIVGIERSNKKSLRPTGATLM